MKLLVTGAGGYIGGYLVDRLLADNCHDIYVLLRPGYTGLLTKNKKIQVLFADLTNKASLERVFKGLSGFDVIYHIAAATSGSHFEAMMGTVVGTENFLSAVSHCDVKRFVLVSSFSVYKLSKISRKGIVTEDCPVEDNLQKRDSYTITKTRQELYVRKFCEKKKWSLAIIRPGKIYGPNDQPIPPQLGLSIPGVCFMIMGGGHILPLTHVANTAEAIYLSGVVDLVGDVEVFNIIDDDLPTQRQFMKLYKKYLGRIPRSLWIPDVLFKVVVKFFEIMTKITKGNIPPVVTKYRADNFWKPLRYDNSYAKSKLGWKPEVTINEGLKEMFQSIVDQEH